MPLNLDAVSFPQALPNSDYQVRVADYLQALVRPDGGVRTAFDSTAYCDAQDAHTVLALVLAGQSIQPQYRNAAKLVLKWFGANQTPEGSWNGRYNRSGAGTYAPTVVGEGTSAVSMGFVASQCFPMIALAAYAAAFKDDAFVCPLADKFLLGIDWLLNNNYDTSNGLFYNSFRFSGGSWTLVNTQYSVDQLYAYTGLMAAFVLTGNVRYKGIAGHIRASFDDTFWSSTLGTYSVGLTGPMGSTKSRDEATSSAEPLLASWVLGPAALPHGPAAMATAQSWVNGSQIQVPGKITPDSSDTALVALGLRDFGTFEATRTILLAGLQSRVNQTYPNPLFGDGGIKLNTTDVSFPCGASAWSLLALMSAPGAHTWWGLSEPEVIFPPVITSFVATPATMVTPTNAVLNAVFSNGTGVVKALTGGVTTTVGTLVSGVNFSVPLQASTEFTLTVTNSAGTTVSAKALVAVGSKLPAPHISSFTPRDVSVATGGSTQLLPVFENGVGVITPGNIPVVSGGSYPSGVLSADKTFTLTVTNTDGILVTATTSVVISVVAPPSITSFTSLASSVTTGNATTLTAMFTGGTGSMNGTPVVSGVPFSSGNLTTIPSAVLTLTVTNTAGISVTRSLTIGVTAVVGVLAITSFDSTPASIASGASAQLKGVFVNGTGSISPRIGAVTSGNSYSTGALTASTPFTLTVANLLTGASDTRTLTVNVVAAVPVITSFTAVPSSIHAGDQVLLRYTFTGGTGVLDHGIGPVTTAVGYQAVLDAGTYTLTVTNADGVAVSKTVDIINLGDNTVGPYPVSSSVIYPDSANSVAADPNGNMTYVGLNGQKISNSFPGVEVWQRDNNLGSGNSYDLAAIPNLPVPSGPYIQCASSGAMCVDPGSGDIYIATGVAIKYTDSNATINGSTLTSGKVYRVSSSGTVTQVPLTVNGQPWLGYSGYYGLPACLFDPSNSKVYVVDSNSIIINDTRLGYGGYPALVDGTGSTAQFGYPQQLCWGLAGEIYVADNYNHAIRKIVLSSNGSVGTVTTLTGNGTAGLVNGTLAQARFSSPCGVVVAPNGDIYVGDYGNNVIRRISGGVVTTIAGTGTSGNVDGPFASAQFDRPAHMAYQNNRLYVVCNGKVRVLYLGSTIPPL